MAAISDKDRVLWLRRLRFPPDLEREYQSRYFAQSIRLIRLGFGILLVILLALTILVGFTQTLGPENFVMLGYPMLTIGISFHPSFRRFWKPYIVLTVAACTFYFFYIGTARVLFDRDYTDVVTRTAIVGWRQALFFITAVGVMRVPFVWTTAWLFAMEIACVGVVIWFLGPPPILLSNYTFISMFFVIFPMLGSLALERYHRADFLSNLLLDQERARSEDLLLNVLPGPIAERLKEDRGAIAENFGEVTVLFADIVGFTPLAASLPPSEVVELLNRVFSRFDELAERHGLEKIKTIGDAYMVVGGLPEPRTDHAQRIAEMALDMQAAMLDFHRPDGSPLSLRVGINSGPVVAGVIGTKRFLYDLWGDTVNMASRMESHGAPGAIQVTQAARDLSASEYEFSEAQEVDVKGRGLMVTYRLIDRV